MGNFVCSRVPESGNFEESPWLLHNILLSNSFEVGKENLIAVKSFPGPLCTYGVFVSLSLPPNLQVVSSFRMSVTSHGEPNPNEGEPLPMIQVTQSSPRLLKRVTFAEAPPEMQDQCTINMVDKDAEEEES